MSRAKKLRALIERKAPGFLMEAHSGLSARLVEEAGFEAIWGSGLSISASLGVRDCNEASWTQILDVVEFMSDATSLPILLDGDTGYGNFNNVRRLITKLEQREIAGVCLEDKLFPKTNSFIASSTQRLAEVDEFCGKVRAAKDTQRCADFVVVARTEAFIAGWGLEEALLRATAYAESGADAVLVHSKRKDGRDIHDFMRHWHLDCPVVIVPTTYPHDPIEGFIEGGVTNFIFANHSLRTVITALRRNLAALRSTCDLGVIESEIVPVSEVFRLQNVGELRDAEERYLPKREEVRALILAATQGNFGRLVEEKPKCMLNLQGRPILGWHRDLLHGQGIKEIAVVRGFGKDKVDLAGLRFFDNNAYAHTGELASIYCAREFLQGHLLVGYGDIIYDQFILRNLLVQDDDIVITVDAGFRLRARIDDARDFVYTKGMKSPVGGNCVLDRIDSGGSVDDASGEWIGLLYAQGEGLRRLVKGLDDFAAEEPDAFARADLPTLLNRLVADGQPISVVHTFGHWRDLDDEADLLRLDQVS